MARLLPQSVLLLVEGYDKKLRLARAYELAGCQQYLLAESVLCPNGRFSDDPDELDLLAQIYVRQHRLDDARSAWKKAASTAPYQGKYLLKLEALHRYQMEDARGALDRGQEIMVHLVCLALGLAFILLVMALFGEIGFLK